LNERGHAYLSGSKLFVSNLVDGIDQYALPSLTRQRTFPHPVLRNFPIQIAMAKSESLLVSGGDDGYTQIFDAETGQFLLRLEHSVGEFVASLFPPLISCDQ
jgi:hypothetical protein